MNLFIVNQCKMELANGKVDSVIDCLLKNTDNNSNLNTEVLLLSYRFHRLRNKELNGTIGSSAAAIQSNRIVEKMINLLEEIPIYTKNQKDIINYEKSLVYRRQLLNQHNLTRQEVDIISLTAQAYSNKEIASLLYITKYAAKTHRRNIKAKLNLSNTADIVRFAFQTGITLP